MTEIEKIAKALYEAVPTVKPAWDQLGTRSVWLERAMGKSQEASQGKTDKGEVQGQIGLF